MIDACERKWLNIVHNTVICCVRACSMHAIKAVWSKLRRDEPELLGNFEEFLSRMSGEMKRTQTDFQSLEHALRK